MTDKQREMASRDRAPNRLPEPASDLRELSDILRRFAEHLAAPDVLDEVRRAAVVRDERQMQQVVNKAAIPGQIQLNERGEVVLAIRLGPIDGHIAIDLRSS